MEINHDRRDSGDAEDYAIYLRDLVLGLLMDTGTVTATTLPTNEPELRAELDAAKRALAEMDVRPSQITVTSLFRCLERLHLAVKGCARIGFEESSPTRNALHFNVWNDLNAAQADAALKLKMFAAIAAKSNEHKEGK